MDIISRVTQFNGQLSNDDYPFGALDTHVLITDEDGNVITTLYNRLQNIKDQTQNLNDIIYWNELHNGAYVINDKTSISNQGYLNIKKINIINTDEDPQNCSLSFESNHNKTYLRWANDFSYFGLVHNTWDSLSQRWYDPGDDFIWYFRSPTANSNDNTTGDFWINVPTHIIDGNLYIQRTDESAFPSINLYGPTRANDNKNIYFRTVIKNDLINANSVRFGQIAFQHITRENLTDLSYDTWTNFLFKNTNQRNVFFPQGIITLGSSTLQNSSVSIQMRNDALWKGIMGTTAGSLGFYDWNWTYPGQETEQNKLEPRTPWLLRHNSYDELISERTFKIYNHKFAIGTIGYDNNGTVITSGDQAYKQFITMEVKDNYGKITTHDIQVKNQLILKTINPLSSGNTNNDNNPNQNEEEDSRKRTLYINSGQIRIYCPYSPAQTTDSNGITIPKRNDYIARTIVGSYYGQRRISTLYVEDNASSNRLSVLGQWNYPKTGQDHDEFYSIKSFLPDSSDIRLKENIEDTTENGLDLINQIQMRQFDWKDSHFHQKIGFVADELEQLDSNLSAGGGYDSEGNFDTKVVNTFYLQAYEVKAIQELSQQVNTLKQQIEELKALLKNK